VLGEEKEGGWKEDVVDSDGGGWRGGVLGGGGCRGDWDGGGGGVFRGEGGVGDGGGVGACKRRGRGGGGFLWRGILKINSQKGMIHNHKKSTNWIRGEVRDCKQVDRGVVDVVPHAKQLLSGPSRPRVGPPGRGIQRSLSRVKDKARTARA